MTFFDPTFNFPVATFGHSFHPPVQLSSSARVVIRNNSQCLRPPRFTHSRAPSHYRRHLAALARFMRKFPRRSIDLPGGREIRVRESVRKEEPQAIREGQRPGKVRVAAGSRPPKFPSRMMLGKRRRLDQDTNGAGPSYAILKLRPDTNCVLLFQHALSLGIVDISFVSHPREFFTSSEAPLLPSQTPDTPHDDSIIQGTRENESTERNGSTSVESPQEVVPNMKLEIRSPSAESSLETEPDSVNQVLATLFGKSEDATLAVPSSSFDEIPVIPSNGTTVCKICYAAVSCRKVTNLSLHALRTHCSVALWRCPSAGCEYAHADAGKVRTHLRHQHIGEEGQPVDNRQPETMEEAREALRKCFPKVDWMEKYQNIFFLTEPPTIIKEERRVAQPELNTWDRLAIKDHMANQLMRCHGCQLTVPVNKKAIEEHIRVIHKPERPYQCGVCEYANPDEWKVRVHMTLKHVDRPFAQVRTCNSWNRPHLFIKRFFPELAESLPVDEIETLIESFKPGRDLSVLTAPPQLLPTIPSTLPSLPDPPPNLSEATVESLLLQMFPAIRGATQQISCAPVQRKPTTGSTLRVDRLGGKVECSLCLAQVEAKRTMLVSHCKSHCPQRQWQCPHCETSAAFHSKLKLHIVNAHKSDAEPLDHYTPELENKWLLLFRQCFPQFAQQCYAEDWKFRSKQQQHYGSHIEDTWRNFEGTEQPRRTILIEGDSSTQEATETKPEI